MKNLIHAHSKLIVFILLLAFYLPFLVRQIALPVADDMARHIKNGEMIVAGHFEVIYQNTYSYTQTDFKFINHHWLSGVIYYLLLQGVSWQGLVIIKIILLLGMFALLFYTTVRESNFWATVFFSIPAILIFTSRSTLRPENFSYLFAALFLYILFRFGRNPKSKLIYLLIPLQILWVNMHIFFFIGIGLAGAYLIQKMVEAKSYSLHSNPLVKRLGIVVILLILASFVNPHGISGVLFPFNIFGNYGVKVSENETIIEYLRHSIFLGNAGVDAFLGSILIFIVSVFILFKNKVRNSLFYSMTGLASAVAGFFLIRAMPLFGIIFLPAASSALSSIRLKAKLQFSERAKDFLIIATSLSLMILTAISWFVNSKEEGWGLGLTPKSLDAANFFKSQKLTGPIFNDYDIGSYILYNLYPGEQVFIDNRPEAFSKKFLEDVYFPLMTDENKWKEGMKTYNFNVIFYYQYDSGPQVREFLWKRIKDPDWSLVYVDQYSIILVRNALRNKSVIDKYAITANNAEKTLQSLYTSNNPDDQIAAADTFNLLGLTDLGTRTFLDVLSKYPGRGKLWMIIGEWELGKNDPRSPLLAMMFLDKAISLGYKTSEAYSYLGAAYFKLNRPENARAALKRSLFLDPTRRDARELVEKLKNL